MECAVSPLQGNVDFIRQFNIKTTKLRVPLNGSIDLTSRCNLGCIHCYVGPQKGDGSHEMDTGRWFSLIDEMADAGCLYLLVTGGEPMLRGDFADIYLYIRKKGILPTVFTNGTLITGDILRLFREYPPESVEISIYGATAGTYETITGVRGSFDKCMTGISGLLGNRTEVRLKTILMTLNRHEFYDMENLARSWGLRFRFDACIFPRLSGDRSPLELRVTPGEAVEKEFSDSERVRSWTEYSARFSGVLQPETLYMCGAGVTSFHVDACGNLKPCLLTTGLTYDLKQGDFMAGWTDIMPRLHEKRPGPAFPCSRCERWAFCSFCPAFFGLENLKEDVCSEYICAMGAQRFKTICYNKK